MILPKRCYQDPALVLQQKQAEPCKGCIHRAPATNGAHAYCENTETRQVLADKRCDKYEEANP